MLDGFLRKVIDPALNRAGALLAGRGWGADRLTLLGFGFGLAAAILIAVGAPGLLAVVPLLLNRVADGLDGAVARATKASDFGGFLDIVADFAFYGMIPLAFALRDGGNAAPAAFLLLTFYINGASFLAFAIMAEKRGLKTEARGEKSLFYTAGLMEGGETILFFIAFCLLPQAFPLLAMIFGTLCLVSATARVLLARKTFRP